MVGKVGELAQALATLQNERARLFDLLDGEPAWHALLQLDAREAGGDPVGAVDSLALRERLALRLDAVVPGWRGIAGIEAAIAALGTVPLGALPRAPMSPEAPDAAGMLSERPVQGGAQVSGPALSLPRVPEPVDPSGVSAAEVRNRSLAQAIGSMQALGAARGATLSDAPAIQPPALGNDNNARAVLGRIRSVDGERLAAPPEVNHTRGGAPALPRPRELPTPPPVAALPVNSISEADRPVMLRPMPDVAPVVVGAGAPDPVLPEARNSSETSAGLDSALRVAALEQELDQLMRRNIEARGLPHPIAQPAAGGWGPSDVASDDSLDEIFLEEAEVEIVSSAAAPVAEGDDWGGADGGRSDEALGPLSQQLRRSQARQAAEAENYAAYHGLIDEASVEIIKLDEPTSGATSAGASALRPLLRLVRDD